MEESQEDTLPLSRPHLFQTNMQSMDDFMEEQDDLNAQRETASAAYILANPTKKQRKASLQPERDRLEAEKKLKKASQEAEKIELVELEKAAVKELGAHNWVGKLLEYRNAHPTTSGIVYTEEVLVVPQSQPRFSCRVLIDENSEHFSSTLSFSNKKDAKKYTSKLAIDWLIENKFMPADGSLKAPKAAPSSVTTKTIGAVKSSAASPKPSGLSYAGQVPDLCIRLGFNVPSYELTKDMENASFWSGYGNFGGDPRIEGKVGEVKGVYGKGSAKEEIAREILSFLKDIERQRMETFENEDEEDQKRKRSSDACDLEKSSGKLVKVVS